MPCPDARKANSERAHLFAPQRTSWRADMRIRRPDGKACRSEGVRTTGGHDRLKGQGKAAVPGRLPPWSELSVTSSKRTPCSAGVRGDTGRD